MVIFKYALDELHELPVGYKVRHFGVCQSLNKLCIWVEVDPEQPKIPVKVAFYGTGHELPDERKQYLGTFTETILDINLVWHYYLFY